MSRDMFLQTDPMAPASKRRVSFARFISESQAACKLVVQPRMGFSSIEKMRAGLLATKNARAHTVGTITVDSYTRVGDEHAIGRALSMNVELNGYPITTYKPQMTQEMLAGICDHSFPVQVRHGSARPQHIFRTLALAGIHATEGGPVSYCLPYGRTPLAESVKNWRECCELFASQRTDEIEPHIETFGGCMLGQLCPPGLLVAISVLEALFFRQSGLRSISLSYAQQINAEQDEQAITALRRLASELLPDCDWHIVLYTYMGKFPRSVQGATRLLKASVRLAVRTGVARLLVKTVAEAHRIPTIAENIRALEVADTTTKIFSQSASVPRNVHLDSQVYLEARTLIDAVAHLDDDLGTGLRKAFLKGYLDVPYCLHPDNTGRSRSCIDRAGRLMWSDIGSMPLNCSTSEIYSSRLTSSGLLEALSYVQNKFDNQSDTVSTTSDSTFIK